MSHRLSELLDSIIAGEIEYTDELAERTQALADEIGYDLSDFKQRMERKSNAAE